MFSHFWSLSIEEQFYLFWPVCLLLARNTRNLKVFVYIVFSLLVLSRLVNVVFLSPGYTSYQLHYMTHADGLCIGSLIAIFKYEGVEDIFRRLARLFGWVIGSHLIMLVLGKLAFSDLPHMPVFSYAETALLFGMLVTFCIVPLPRSRVTTLMTNKPLRYLGRISYGLYVYHRPILVLSKLFVAAYLERFIPNGTILSLIAAFIALIAAMVLSTASFYFIERPILSVKSKLTTSGILAVLRKRLPFLPRIAFTK